MPVTIFSFHLMHQSSSVKISVSLCIYYLTLLLLLLACAKSHMLSASRRQPHLIHVSAVDRRQTWSMDKSWQCVTLYTIPRDKSRHPHKPHPVATTACGLCLTGIFFRDYRLGWVPLSLSMEPLRLLCETLHARCPLCDANKSIRVLLGVEEAYPVYDKHC